VIPAMIVPVLTAPHLLYRMVASIDYPVRHLVIIDNGRCVDPTQLGDWAGRIEQVNLLPIPANLGVAGSWNLGIKVTPFAPWWLVANFDITWPSGSLSAWDTGDRRGTLCLSAGSPPWCAFSVGEQVVARVGLFDEGLHPAYFEDNDYQRRVEHAGLPVDHSGIPVHHDNSSTLANGYRDKNHATYQANANYYRRKQSLEDFTAGEWRLSTRRAQSWD
jgi:GT2 family glycosyltransferase